MKYFSEKKQTKSAAMGRDKKPNISLLCTSGPHENLPKSEAERKWRERIMALGCPVEKIRKPFWYKHVKVTNGTLSSGLVLR